MKVRLRSLRRRFWLEMNAGRSYEEAAAEVGINWQTGKRWFRQAGGVAPSHLHVQASGRFLNLAEREEIFVGVERDESIRQIARRLGRAPSTVLRELRRNMRHRYRARTVLDRHRGRTRLLPWDYRPSTAQRSSDARAARPKPAKLAQSRRLRREVEARLAKKWSPQQMARAS